MNELSLFSGAGGGLLGTKMLGFRHVGYVEINDYCQRVIAQRIKDGLLDEAPIFGDIRAFVGDGYAESYKGLVDVISAGFPCQPFSVAGKREAANDERNMWPATLDVIKKIRPHVCWLENVPGLLSATVDDESGRSIHYFGTILRDLAESGYDAKWAVLGADDVGAPHHRKRLWIYATDTNSESIDDSELTIRKSPEQSKQQSGSLYKQINVAYAGSKRRKRIDQEKIQGQSTLPWGENIRGLEDLRKRSDIPESLIRGVDDGVANRMDRLKAIGNGQVPATVLAAWEMLTR